MKLNRTSKLQLLPEVLYLEAAGDEPTPNIEDYDLTSAELGDEINLEELSINEKGELVDKDAKTVLEAEKLEEFKKSKDSDETDDDEGEITYDLSGVEGYNEGDEVSLDDAGNLINADGELLLKAEDLESRVSSSKGETEVTVISQVIASQGYEFKDGDGNDKVYEDTTEGISEYLADVMQHQRQEFVKELNAEKPKIVADFENYIKTGGRPTDFLKNPLNDVQNIVLDKNDKNQMKEIIAKLYEARGFDRTRAYKMADRSEAVDELEDDATDALTELKQLDAARSEQLSKEAEAVKKREEENIIKTQNEVKSIISKGEIEGIAIPKNEQKAFEDYLFKPIKKVGNQMYSQHEVDASEESISRDVWNAYLRYKGYNMTDLIKQLKGKVNVDNLTSMIRRNKQVSVKVKKGERSSGGAVGRKAMSIINKQ